MITTVFYQMINAISSVIVILLPNNKINDSNLINTSDSTTRIHEQYIVFTTQMTPFIFPGWLIISLYFPFIC